MTWPSGRKRSSAPGEKAKKLWNNKMGKSQDNAWNCSIRLRIFALCIFSLYRTLCTRPMYYVSVFVGPPYILPVINVCLPSLTFWLEPSARLLLVPLPLCGKMLLIWFSPNVNLTSRRRLVSEWVSVWQRKGFRGERRKADVDIVAAFVVPIRLHDLLFWWNCV